MTSHYLDFQLRPDPDFSIGQLMGILFSKLHRRLVALDNETIGLSFPAYQIKPRDIGTHLRIHGSSADLETLIAEPWLGGMRGHVDVSNIATAPTDAVHRTVTRRQFKTNAERLRRRRMRRHNESEATALARIPDGVEHFVSLPFVQVRSRSTRQQFSLFIENGPTQSSPQPGTFNSYGLSHIATVPWF